MSPLILVTSDVKQIDGYAWHSAIEFYLKALTLVGATPVILPSLGTGIDIDTALGRVDGVVATGSRSNVHPELYGAAPGEQYEPYDSDRDATSLPLIREAIDRNVPMLAICRGMQELNVALGGTLITEVQTLPDRMDHRAPESDSQDERFGLAHDVHFEADAGLARLIGCGTVRVNSLHRQVIDVLADRLIVEARAEDGTIEAVRVANAANFAYGVQWHPEYWAASDAPSKSIFQAFTDAARDYGAQGRPELAAE